MLQLLKIEWMKVKNYRTFWILAVLYPISLWGINYIVYAIQQMIFSQKQGKEMVTIFVGPPPYSFPTVWQMTAHVSSYLLIIPGLLLIISVTNEYSFKTHRQNVIDGWSRAQFISTKLMLGVIVAFASTIIVFLTALSFGLLEGSNPISFENFYYLGYFFLQALSYCWIAILFSIVLKRSGIALGVFFLYTLILENVLATALNHYVYGIGKYLPIESTDVLMPAPVFKIVQKQFSVDVNPSIQIALACVLLVLYFFLILRKYKTDDL